MKKIISVFASTVFLTVAFSYADAESPTKINLGSAENYVILAKTGISTTGATSVVGNLGVSPAEATYITGFSLILPAAGAYSTSALVTGKIYAPGYADPTATNLTTAVLDMQTAYTDGMGRTTAAVELGAGNIGGLTIAPGVYKWGTGVTIPTDVTLSGGANDIWIFQIAQNLDISSAKKIILAGGAQANNIFWVVAGQTTIGTTAVFNGNILDQTAIVLNTGAVLNGRALAQTAVTLDANMVTIQTSSASVPLVVTTPVMPVALVVTTSSNSSGQQPTLPSAGISTEAEKKMALETQLAELLVSFHSLQANVQVKTQEGSSLGAQVRVIAKSFEKGSRGSEVSTLQQFLISQNKGSSAQALATHGTTIYFGDLTRAALAEFQASVGISPAVGYFGPITRKYLSTHN